MYGDSFTFVALASIALLSAVFASHILKKRWPQPLILLGVVVRILGSMVYYEVIMSQYQGAADAFSYYRNGLALADLIWQGDFGGFLDNVFSGGRWWGTSFVDGVSGVVLAIVGPHLRAEFLVFALIAFLGLLALAEAVRRTYRGQRTKRYAALVFLWPSLWFWPSTVGKESLVILGLGLACLGYVGRAGRTQWVWLISGVGLTFCCRPHVALAIMFSMLLAHIARPAVRLSAARLAQIATLGLATWVTFVGTASLFGIEERNQIDIGGFAEQRAEKTLRGGSSLTSTPIQEGKPWLAFLNIWMRPFPWEVKSAVSALAAAEVLTFWFLAVFLRKSVWFNLTHWRMDALLRFALPMIIGYSLMLGSIVGNLGILVRQRTIILPLAFLILVADSAKRLGEEGGQSRLGRVRG